MIGRSLKMETFERNPDPLEAAAALKRDGAIVINAQMDTDVVQIVASELRNHFDSEGRYTESDFNGYNTLRVSAILAKSRRSPASSSTTERVWALWDAIDPAGLEAENPVQRGHIYHQDEALGYMAGVWDCTAMTGKLEPYAVHEFMFLLEGSVIMVLEDGVEITVNAGEAFVIPKGLVCQWKQPGYVRKVFMIFEDPGAPAADDVAKLGIILPRSPVEYRDPSGRMIVGVRDSAPFDGEMRSHPHHELAHLLEGAVTITGGDGASQTFEAGDTFYIPQGAVCGWQSSGSVTALYASLNGATK
jgi:uncharacterized cupin superfamily protein